jgi:hypothetical protein
MRFDTGENSMFMSFNLKKLLGAFGVVLLLMSPLFAFGDQTPAPAAPAASAPAAAPAAAPAPTPNKGDVSWMLVSTALVLMMSVPALALFYGGMVRSKNALSVLMQVFVVFSLITVLWCVYGYSLAFTEGHGSLAPFFGGLDRLFLKGTFNAADGSFSMAGTFSKGTPLYELVFVAFQATFAAITCALILGAFVERVKFSAVLIFMVIWFTFAYLPISHMVWFWMGPDVYTAANVVDAMNAKAGLLWQWGALDFAGGTVVHINAGVAGLVGAYVIGKRIGFGKEHMAPHNVTMTMIGASLLWVGWFGFNAGSALEANGSASLAFMNTYLATACADLQEQALDARCCLGCGRGSRSDHASGRQCRHPGCIRHWHRRRSRLPLGRQPAQELAQGRRLTGRFRCTCRWRRLRCVDDRCIQCAVAGRTRFL